MQIRLTDHKSGESVTIAAELILSCRNVKGNKVQNVEDHTQVLTGIHTSQGTAQIQCSEPAERVAKMVNYALRMAQDPTVALSLEALGFKLG